MKTLITTALTLTIFFGVLTTGNVQAQSAEEVEAMINEIIDLMRDIEQKFNKIALEPEQLSEILRQLLKAAQDGKPENMPEAIKDYLINNPAELAKLIEPEADAAKIKELKKMIRKSLQTDDGLNLLIKKYPQILKNLMQQEEILKQALKKYLKDENDLQSIFENTNREMLDSEDKLKELIKLANKMQQKMNSDAKEKEEQEKEDEEDGDKPKNPNEKPNDNDPKEYDPSEGEEGKSKTNPTDRNAWDNPLPPKEYERTREARSNTKPKGYEEYANEYFKLLSQFERKLEESKKDKDKNGEDADKEKEKDSDS
ncbi:MAG: hypothetical protein K8S87_11465, partial [Planctomycetes bacterium]|nr:hypothetical protein [Planctomycetota bacterium]